MGASLKVAWNAGELSPLLDGRSDLAKYHQGCSILENFIPTVHGPVYRRPGTRFVENCNGIAPVLVPFVFNRDQSYVLAIGAASGIAVYADRGRVLNDPVAPATVGTPYWFGAGVWNTPPRRADGTSRISYTQSGDTLFVCDSGGNLPLMAIVRHDNNDWSIAPYEMAVPPADEWNNGLCLLYKKKADGTEAPTGQYYIAVDVGELQYSANKNQLTETINLSPADMSGNFFKARRRGKVFLDFGARVGPDWRNNGANSDPIWGAPYRQNPGRIVTWETGMYLFHGQVVMHNGRFYETINEGHSNYEPLHEGPRGISDTGLYYIGNGRVCFEIIESGIEDEFVESDGTRNAIYCALVKMAAHPTNEEDLEGRVFERHDSMNFVGVIGTHFHKEAAVHFKCKSWAAASVRDFIPEIMVTPLPTIGAIPDNVSIYRERLVLSVNRQLHMSVAGDFPNFTALDGAGQVVADMALDLDLLAGDLSPVSWMSSSEKLVIGSFGGERAIGEQNLANAFGPTNVKVDVSTSNGSRDVPPAVIGSDVLYVDRSGRRVRRSGLALDPADSADLSILSEHIGARSTFIDSAWQQSPSFVLWFAQDDGGLAALTYDRAQDVIAWHRHNVGGNVKAICSIPSPDGTRDDLWLVVQRTVNGASKTYLEVMPDDFRLGRPVSEQNFLDCSLEYNGASTTTLTGLSHLNGETVSIIGDGCVLAPQKVISGSVTLSAPSTRVFVGLNNPSRLRTMRLEKSPDGVSLGKISRIHRVVLQLIDTVGVKVGPTFLSTGERKMDRKEFRDATMSMDAAVPIQTRDIEVDFPSGYDTTGYVCIEQDQPLPCTILSAAIEYQVQS